MSSSTGKAAPLRPEERDQVRTWLERERYRAFRAADRAAEDAGELLRRKGERDPCAYRSPTAAQEDTELAGHSRRASANMQHIRGITEALRSLEDEPERFGMCDVCEDAISMERLELIPHARACGSCASRRRV